MVIDSYIFRIIKQDINYLFLSLLLLVSHANPYIYLTRVKYFTPQNTKREHKTHSKDRNPVWSLPHCHLMMVDCCVDEFWVWPSWKVFFWTEQCFNAPAPVHGDTYPRIRPLHGRFDLLQVTSPHSSLYHPFSRPSTILKRLVDCCLDGNIVRWP